MKNILFILLSLTYISSQAQVKSISLPKVKTLNCTIVNLLNEFKDDKDIYCNKSNDYYFSLDFLKEDQFIISIIYKNMFFGIEFSDGYMTLGDRDILIFNLNDDYFIKTGEMKTISIPDNNQNDFLIFTNDNLPNWYYKIDGNGKINLIKKTYCR